MWRLIAQVLLGGALASAAACSRCAADHAPAPQAQPSSDAQPASNHDSEQARFDEERRPDLIVAALDLRPGARVADIGAGSGLLTVHLARAVAPTGKVVATDIENAVLDLLRSRVHERGLDDVVEPRVVEPDRPGLELGGYDVILLAEVDNFFSDPAAWLAAAKPALRPHGAIAITNRIYHRARALAAAKAAGLHLVTESTPVPSTFLAVFRVEPPPPSKGPTP